jgi:hypothetical protein
MNQRELDHHLMYIANQLLNYLEDSGRFNRLSNPVIGECLNQIYKPMVNRINSECNERIDLYQREIELLKAELAKAKDEAGYRCVGSWDNKYIYIREENHK